MSNLQHLPAEEREVLRLRLNGRSGAEVARQTGRPLAQVAVGVFALGGSQRTEAHGPLHVLRTLTVTGSATVTAAPDGASIDIHVSALRPTASEALAAGAEALNGVRAALSEHGVADEDLQTVRIALDEDFDYDYTTEARVSIGFRFSNTIRVIIDGVDTIGDIIDAAVGTGGDTVAINRIRFLVSNRVALEDTARLAAIDEARRKAAAMAERAGVRLGRVRVIEEIGHSTPVGVEGVLEEDAADSAPTAAPIFGGDEQVTASVRIIFRIY